MQKNISHEGVYEVNSGTTDISKLTEIFKINNRRSINYWKNNPDKSISVCNMINGTDGGSFPPHIKSDDSFYIYSSDICRFVAVFNINQLL